VETGLVYSGCLALFGLIFQAQDLLFWKNPQEPEPQKAF